MASSDEGSEARRRSTRKNGSAIKELAQRQSHDLMEQSAANAEGASTSSNSAVGSHDGEAPHEDAPNDDIPPSEFEVTQDGETHATQTVLEDNKARGMRLPSTPLPGNQEAETVAVQPVRGGRAEPAETRQMPPPAKKSGTNFTSAVQSKKRKEPPQHEPETHAAKGADKSEALPDPETTSKDHSKQGDARKASDSNSDASTAGEPAEPIVGFDWNDLYTRYNKRMDELTAEEHRIWEDFNNLSNLFNAWVTASQDHEVGRSTKRLRTQATLVQYHEGELEVKRQHYIKVVEAFQSALKLLGHT